MLALLHARFADWIRCFGAGTLVRDFKHLALDMFLIEEEGQKKLRVEMSFGKRKTLAAIRTCCSHVIVSPPSA